MYTLGFLVPLQIKCHPHPHPVCMSVCLASSLSLCFSISVGPSFCLCVSVSVFVSLRRLCLPPKLELMALYSRTSHPFSPVPESHAGKLEAVRLHLQQQMVHRHLHHPVSQQEGPVRGEDQKVLSHRLLSRIHWSVRINVSFRCGFSLTSSHPHSLP